MRLLSLLFLVLFGCKATVGTNTLVSVPPDARPRCESYCRDLKLSLSSVVVMANEVGCVCSVAGATADANAAATAAGMLTAKEKERARRDQETQQSQNDSAR